MPTPQRDLRPIVAGLLGRDLERYSAGAMTYDLRRLRLHGLIQRLPHSFRYTLTADGLYLAFGLSRIVLRLLQPSWASLLSGDRNLPASLRDALVRLDTAIRSLADAEDVPTPALPRAAWDLTHPGSSEIDELAKSSSQAARSSRGVLDRPLQLVAADKLLLVADQAPYHGCGGVRDFLADSGDRWDACRCHPTAPIKAKSSARSETEGRGHTGHAGPGEQLARWLLLTCG